MRMLKTVVWAAILVECMRPYHPPEFVSDSIYGKEVSHD